MSKISLNLYVCFHRHLYVNPVQRPRYNLPVEHLESLECLKNQVKYSWIETLPHACLSLTPVHRQLTAPLSWVTCPLSVVWLNLRLGISISPPTGHNRNKVFFPKSKFNTLLLLTISQLLILLEFLLLDFDA